MGRMLAGLAFGVVLASAAFVLFLIAEGARWCRR